VQVRLAGEPLAPGLTAVEVVLDVPGGEGLDVAGGPGQLRARLCDLDRLELALAPAFLAGLAARLAGPGAGAPRAFPREGFLELAGETADGAPFTLKAAAVASGGAALRVALYEPRLYAPAALPAPALAPRAAAAIAAAFPGARADGAFAELAPLRPALLALLPRRGFKLPRTAGARAGGAALSPAGARVAWSRWDAAVEPPDPDLRALLHGAPAFAREEAALARGDADAARDAWRALPPGARAHPFAAARTLGLLVADARFHAEARAVSRAALLRDEGFAPALAAEALLARARGDDAAAAGWWSALALVAVRRGEPSSARAAALACAACGAGDPVEAAAALDAALALDRADVPVLRALRDVAARGGDRARLLRACRGLAAHAAQAAEKADAHRRLAELLAVTDPAAARLHRENARRLGGDG
jgi:hypothetical protein